MTMQLYQVFQTYERGEALTLLCYATSFDSIVQKGTEAIAENYTITHAQKQAIRQKMISLGEKEEWLDLGYEYGWDEMFHLIVNEIEV